MRTSFQLWRERLRHPVLHQPRPRRPGRSRPPPPIQPCRDGKAVQVGRVLRPGDHAGVQWGRVGRRRVVRRVERRVRWDDHHWERVVLRVAGRGAQLLGRAHGWDSSIAFVMLNLFYNLDMQIAVVFVCKRVILKWVKSRYLAKRLAQINYLRKHPSNLFVIENQVVFF